MEAGKLNMGEYFYYKAKNNEVAILCVFNEYAKLESLFSTFYYKRGFSDESIPKTIHTPWGDYYYIGEL